jgi:hypothetical protein
MQMSWIKDYLFARLKLAENRKEKETVVYTEEQLMARLKFFIGICLSLTLFGIVFVVLYSLIFVTQPLNAISPIDQKFFELIIPIATFLTGTLSGIMLASPGDKEAQKEALKAANKGWDKPPAPISPTPAGSNSFGASNFGGGFNAQPQSNFSGGFNAQPQSNFGGGFGGDVVGGQVMTTAAGKKIVPIFDEPEM